MILQRMRTAGSHRYLAANLAPDGALEIDGQDLGHVAGGGGAREYEWSWRVPAEHVAHAIEALAGRKGDPPLAVVRAWFEANGRTDPGVRLREAGVKVEFWSRMGD
jgi:hypothetical protein